MRFYIPARLIVFHDSMAKNGEKESILDSEESEATQSHNGPTESM